MYVCMHVYMCTWCMHTYTYTMHIHQVCMCIWMNPYTIHTHIHMNVCAWCMHTCTHTYMYHAYTHCVWVCKVPCTLIHWVYVCVKERIKLGKYATGIYRGNYSPISCHSHFLSWHHLFCSVFIGPFIFTLTFSLMEAFEVETSQAYAIYSCCVFAHSFFHELTQHWVSSASHMYTCAWCMQLPYIHIHIKRMCMHALCKVHACACKYVYVKGGSSCALSYSSNFQVLR